VSVGISHVLVVSALVFGAGTFGLLARRNLFGMVLSLQLMLAGAEIALVGFSRLGDREGHPLSGMAFALLAILASAAEVVVAVALVLLVYRRHRTVQVDELDALGRVVEAVPERRTDPELDPHVEDPVGDGGRARPPARPSTARRA
jgi:NADH-quinone oxidoreductase subunit K